MGLSRFHKHSIEFQGFPKCFRGVPGSLRGYQVLDEFQRHCRCVSESFYGFLMVFRGVPESFLRVFRVFQGRSKVVSGRFRSVPWDFKKFRGVPRAFQAISGAFQGFSLSLMGFMDI